MNQFVIRSLKNGQEIILNGLSIDEVNRLHYEEEVYAASVLKSLPAFSDDRYEFYNKCYNDVIEVTNRYRRIIYPSNTGKGSKKYELKLINKVINKCFSKTVEKRLLKVLEIGCGNCVLLNELANDERLDVYGCDLHPNENHNERINIIRADIFTALNNFTDGTIDLLISDNVCEHFFRDEADSIYASINKKLSPNGKAVFFIPDGLIGPSDISGIFLKTGEAATGFHFMEQSYSENIELFKQHSLITEYCIVKTKRIILFIRNFAGIIESVKIGFERLLAKAPVSNKIKKQLFGGFGYYTYVLKKNDKV